MEFPDWWVDAESEVHDCVRGFTNQLADKIEGLQPHKLIEKNPFLYRARGPEDAATLATYLLNAYLSSSEETIFGTILEQIAQVLCAAGKDGRKSGIPGIDIEYDVRRQRTLVQVKSGPHWGNSSQQEKLRDNFRTATRILRQGSDLHVRCVEGICYGPSNTKDKGSHVQLVGFDFWEDVCGWREAGRGVLHIIGEHGGNGLRDIRTRAREDIVSYFRDTSICREDLTLNWDRLFDLIMTSARNRPRFSKKVRHGLS